MILSTCSRGNFIIKDETLVDIEGLCSEAEGLKALDDTHTIRVPTPYAHGVLEGENCGYLATEVRIVLHYMI